MSEANVIRLSLDKIMDYLLVKKQKLDRNFLATLYADISSYEIIDLLCNYINSKELVEKQIDVQELTKLHAEYELLKSRCAYLQIKNRDLINQCLTKTEEILEQKKKLQEKEIKIIELEHQYMLLEKEHELKKLLR